MALIENDKREGKIAKAIEKETTKLPSDLFLIAAVTSIGASLGLRIFGKKHSSLFVGQWAAPILLLGLYNKLVKLEGHDQIDDSPQ